MSKVFQFILFYFVYPLMKLLFRVEINAFSEFHNVPIKNSPLIIASNHTHFLDPIIAGWAITKYFRSLGYSFNSILPIRFIVAAEYFDFLKSPPFFPISLIVATFVRINRSIPVLRGSKEDLQKKLQPAVDVLNKNGKIFIFPEGKISKDGMLLKGKVGVGYLHKVTKACILPIAIINLSKFKGLKGFISFLINKERVKIYLGEPIINVSDLSIEEITSITMESIKKLIEIDNSIKSIENTKFETHNILVKTIRLFLVPIINNLPSYLVKLILAKTTKDSKNVLSKPGTTHAIEVLYTFHERKKEIFKRGLLNGFFTYFWHTFLSQPKAIRNRLKIVENLYYKNIEKLLLNQKSTIKILSIGGGSCKAGINAIYKLTKDKHQALKAFKIYLFNIDKNPEVFDLTKNLINKYDLQYIIEFHGIVGNAKKIEELNIKETFDIIEIVGLLDYFADEESIKLLSYCYQNLLNENGTLIWGNIQPNNEMKFLEKINWPKMYYRTLPMIINIINLSKIPIEITDIYKEPLNIHWIITHKK